MNAGGGLGPRAERLEPVSSQLAQQSFCHHTARRILSAEKQHLIFFGHVSTPGRAFFHYVQDSVRQVLHNRDSAKRKKLWTRFRPDGKIIERIAFSKTGPAHVSAGD